MTSSNVSKLELEVKWKDSYKLAEARNELNDGGSDPDWDGEDYGLYQIYGKHILNGSNTLLYIGRASDQTFSVRFGQHEWLDHEEKIRIYVGRVHHPEKVSGT